MIPFEIRKREVCTANGNKVLDDYEELKEWRYNEE
jgi:hypothetical protein